MVMTGAHDSFLVALSILIAICASFTALDIAGRLRVSEGWMRQVWVWAAAVSLGGGIWAMHFVAMLAFSLPGVSMGYDVGLTLLSLTLAVAFTAAGFTIMGWRQRFRWRAVAAGLLMGAGVLAMHYVGMAAMQMAATLSYTRAWVAISVLIAIGAASAAVWLASRDRVIVHRVLAATAMGAAIAGMHYAGMRAAVFTAATPVHASLGRASLDQTVLAVSISTITAIILLLALGAARIESLFRGFARREARSELRVRIADILRRGSAKDALEEVAALMGEHFGVTRTGFGDLDPVEDIFTYEVCWTDGVPPLLGRFPASAFGVKIVAALNAGRTIVVEDLFEAQLSDEAKTRETARDVDTRAILVVPFVREGRLRSIVYLNDRRPRRWHADDVAFLEELAERTRLVIERDAADAQLRELNASLEARVDARTAELRQAQEALMQSQKMEAVGQLVSGVAHDFNNVLAAVVGAFELIRRRPDDPDRVRQFADAGLQAAERGSKLTTQLLAFSRAQTIQLQPILVCDVIEDIRDLLARTVGPMVRLNLDLNPDPQAVMADPTQVEMMVLNLAINARDAMPDGGVLTIATKVKKIARDAELADGAYVEIMVRDTGVGMDAATLRRAMEPFFTTKPVGKGTGLGLAQIYGGARQSGGTVRIESKPGSGTTVRVYLPCTEREPIRLADQGPAADQPPLRPVRLLLVDDDQDHRQVLAGGLEALGHSVTQAVDGAGALACLEQAVPEILVLDYAMPGMSGAELAVHVRRRWPKLPIVFTSGFADLDAIHAVDGEAARILRKPFRLEALLQAIGEAVAADVASTACS